MVPVGSRTAASGRKRVWIGTVVVVLAIGAIVAAVLAPRSSALLVVGVRAPAFTLKTPQGRTVSLPRLRGKAVLLEFFATWCPHCNAEAPRLDSLYASLPKSRIAFVSVNADGEAPAGVKAFQARYGIRFPVVLDPSSHRQGTAGPVTAGYRVRAYPTFYVVDPNGRISWRGEGEQSNAELRFQLVQALSGR